MGYRSPAAGRGRCCGSGHWSPSISRETEIIERSKRPAVIVAERIKAAIRAVVTQSMLDLSVFDLVQDDE